MLNPLDFAKEEYASLKKRLALKQKYQLAFEGPGKVVLQDIIRRGGIFSTSVLKNDPYQTAFLEGKRALALEILSMLRMDNEVAMLALLNERETSNE